MRSAWHLRKLSILVLILSCVSLRAEAAQFASLRAREQYGLKLIAQKSYKKAINVLAPYSNEISNEAMMNLAGAYEKTGDSANQIRMLEQLVSRDPDHFRPHYLLGVAYQQAGKTDKAVENLRMSIRLAPEHRPSYDALLDIFQKGKQDYETRTLLAQMVQQFGPRGDLLSLQCKLFSNDGFLNQAIKTCQSAITAAHSLPDNRIYLAQAYLNSDKLQAAERVFIETARQFKHSEFAQYATGEFYFSQKNYPAAVRYLTQAVHLDAKSVRSQLSLAKSLFEIQKYNEALVHYNIACKLDKKKDSLTEFENAAARLRNSGQDALADKYDARTAVCEGGI